MQTISGGDIAQNGRKSVIWIFGSPNSHRLIVDWANHNHIIHRKKYLLYLQIRCEIDGLFDSFPQIESPHATKIFELKKSQINVLHANSECWRFCDIHTKENVSTYCPAKYFIRQERRILIQYIFHIYVSSINVVQIKNLLLYSVAPHWGERPRYHTSLYRMWGPDIFAANVQWYVYVCVCATNKN